MKRLFILFGIIGLFLLSNCGQVTKKTYVIGRDPTWSSANLHRKETSLLGFTDELIAWIAQNQGINISIISSKGSNLFPGLDKHEFDGIFTVRIPGPTVISKYELSNPFLLLGPVLVVQESSTIQSLDDLKKKSVGVLRNSVSPQTLEKYSSVLITPFDTLDAAVESLLRNNLDAVVMDVIPAYTYVKMNPGKLKVATAPLTNEGLRLITLKQHSSKKLIDHFNQGLEASLKQGVYQELMAKWEVLEL